MYRIRLTWSKIVDKRFEDKPGLTAGWVESPVKVEAKSGLGCWLISLSLPQANSLSKRDAKLPLDKNASLRTPADNRGSCSVPFEKKPRSTCCSPYSRISLPDVLSSYSHSVSMKYSETNHFLMFGRWDLCFHFHRFQVAGGSTPR